jgi:hypothetical protein
MTDHNSINYDNKGILYIASGSKYIDEVCRSAQSLKTTDDIQCTLITDTEVECNHLDEVIIKDPPEQMTGELFKLSNMDESPYEKTLFLDSDTYINKSIIDMFRILDHFDLAAAHAPKRNTDRVSQLPAWFPEYNTGVLFYNKGPMNDFAKGWESNYRELNHTNDQLSFRKTLFQKDELQFFTLLPEHNSRTNFPGYLDKDLKILHERRKNPEDIAETIDSIEGPKVHFRRNDRIRCVSNGPSIFNRAKLSVSQNGLLYTIKRGIEIVWSRYRVRLRNSVLSDAE